MDWKRGAENIRLFSPGFAAGEATFREACFFFAGDTTVAVVFEQRGGSPTTRGVLFLNQPPSGLLTLLLRISLGRVVGIGTPRSWRTSSIILCRADFDLRRLLFVCFCFLFFFFFSFFFGWISIDYFIEIYFFLFTNVSCRRGVGEHEIRVRQVSFSCFIQRVSRCARHR